MEKLNKHLQDSQNEKKKILCIKTENFTKNNNTIMNNLENKYESIFISSEANGCQILEII